MLPHTSWTGIKWNANCKNYLILLKYSNIQSKKYKCYDAYINKYLNQKKKRNVELLKLLSSTYYLIGEPMPEGHKNRLAG